ncbi:hypothetical protein FD724_38330 (plasmid) [Nostoc sp. C057]|uniref:hypothetical protein n=1 Tax=Nostoc sp. C057 TaxID=2576903 RepID=UPI0015C39588|nr:hypothetical protein [Nostoc sp. C057]QLE53716.1 hypothetical protein FD724_38330 [Nostoc sp. C057]
MNPAIRAPKNISKLSGQSGEASKRLDCHRRFSRTIRNECRLGTFENLVNFQFFINAKASELQNADFKSQTFPLFQYLHKRITHVTQNEIRRNCYLTQKMSHTGVIQLEHRQTMEQISTGNSAHFCDSLELSQISCQEVENCLSG